MVWNETLDVGFKVSGKEECYFLFDITEYKTIFICTLHICSDLLMFSNCND